MINQIKIDLESALSVHKDILSNDVLIEQLGALATKCLYSLQNGGKIIFAGNGGSFADSQHLAAEFVSRLQFDRAPLPSIALATNSSLISAIGNDYGFEQVFAREIAVLGNANDVFIPITTSGNSPNILAAVNIAKTIGIHTVGFTGTGGKLAELTSCVQIPSNRTERIQEGHILIGHILCGLVENAYFKA
ncbi:MAG TPA: SIS domain-containing protein [Sphingobacteriaceae bacterium]